MRNYIIKETPNELPRLSADESSFEYTPLREYNSERREQCMNIIMTAHKNKQITDGNVRMLIARLEGKETWDETFDLYEQAYKDLIHAIKHHEYYKMIERIEAGEEMLKDEKDKEKADEYRDLLEQLKAKLEELTPKEETA